MSWSRADRRWDAEAAGPPGGGPLHAQGDRSPMTHVIRHLNLFMTSLAAAIFGGWLMLA